MNQIIISKLDNGNYMVQTPSLPKGQQWEQAASVVTEVRLALNLLKLSEPPPESNKHLCVLLNQNDPSSTSDCSKLHFVRGKQNNAILLTRNGHEHTDLYVPDLRAPVATSSPPNPLNPLPLPPRHDLVVSGCAGEKYTMKITTKDPWDTNTTTEELENYIVDKLCGVNLGEGQIESLGQKTRMLQQAFAKLLQHLATHHIITAPTITEIVGCCRDEEAKLTEE